MAAIIGLFNGLLLLNVGTLNYFGTPDIHLLEDGEVWNMDTVATLKPPLNSLQNNLNYYQQPYGQIKSYLN